MQRDRQPESNAGSLGNPHHRLCDGAGRGEIAKTSQIAGSDLFRPKMGKQARGKIQYAWLSAAEMVGSRSAVEAVPESMG